MATTSRSLTCNLALQLQEDVDTYLLTTRSHHELYAVAFLSNAAQRQLLLRTTSYIFIIIDNYHWQVPS